MMSTGRAWSVRLDAWLSLPVPTVPVGGASSPSASESNESPAGFCFSALALATLWVAPLDLVTFNLGLGGGACTGTADEHQQQHSTGCVACRGGWGARF